MIYWLFVCLFEGMNGQGMPGAAMQMPGVPAMQVSAQGMMPPVMTQSIPGHDTSAGPTAAQSGQPLKFDISQILSVIRNNMSAAAQNNE